MHRAMASMACCGIPELFTGFFLRAKFSNFPPVQYEIFKVRLICAQGRGSMADLLSDVGLFDTGTDYAVLPGKNLRNENADTCQAIAFLCLHIFIFCVPILYQKQPIPSRELRGKNTEIGKGKLSRLLRKKRLRCNSFFFKTRSPGIVYRFSG